MPLNINGKKHGTLKEIADVGGFTAGRLRQLCIAGRIKGALKDPSGTWFAPLPLCVIASQEPRKCTQKISMQTA